MPQATIVIVTRNRKEKAAVAIQSALSQRGDFEVLVIDDCSTDNTSEMVHSRFPTVRVERFTRHVGYIVHRNHAVRVANSAFIVSIDDDAVFADDGVVEGVLREFDAPAVAAVAIPHINFYRSGRREPWWPDAAMRGGPYCSSTFIGTAYALRKDIFLQLEGFRECLFHWGEELEYSLRVYNAGLYVKLASVGLIHHFPEGVNKFANRLNRYVVRNGMLTAWLNAPLLYLPALLFRSIALGLLSVARGHEEPRTVFEGVLGGFSAIFQTRKLRAPLPLKVFRQWLAMHRRRFCPLAEWLAQTA